MLQADMDRVGERFFRVPVAVSGNWSTMRTWRGTFK